MRSAHHQGAKSSMVDVCYEAKYTGYCEACKKVEVERLIEKLQSRADHSFDQVLVIDQSSGHILELQLELMICW
jgi:hypothetical protein